MGTDASVSPALDSVHVIGLVVSSSCLDFLQRWPGTWTW